MAVRHSQAFHTQEVIRFQLLAYHSTDHKPMAIYDSNALMTNNFYKAARLDTSKATYWLQLYGRTPEGYSIVLHVDFWPSVMVCLPISESQRARSS